jgi:hypothetical protein
MRRIDEDGEVRSTTARDIRRSSLGRRVCLAFVLLAAAAIGADPAGAHNVGDSYLYLQVYEDEVTGRFEIALSDLNPALGLIGTELEITPENLASRIDFLHDYYREHVEIIGPGGPLEIVFRDHDLLGGSHGYVLLPFDLEGLDGVPERLTFEYSVLFDEDPGHRGFLLVEHNWATGTFANENRIALAFTPMARRQEFDLTSSNRLAGFLALARIGAEHLLLGLDHLLFLFALLLPVALRRETGRWRPVDDWRAVVTGVAPILGGIVSGHLVALVLAAIGIAPFSEALVEAIIAASITLAALHILIPVFRRWVGATIFALALFHGYGFAAALLDLGAVEEHLWLSLLAFFLGIEAAQLAVTTILLPALFLVRRWRLYLKVAMPAAAIGLMALSGIWTIERGFGVDVPLRELLPPAIQKVIP